MIQYGILESNQEKIAPPNVISQQNEGVLLVPDTTEESEILNSETLEALSELEVILRNIHNRLIQEGYTIQDGKITK